MGFKLTIEVPVFLSTFGFMLTLSAGSNLIIYRTCYVLLGFDKEQCSELGFKDNNVTEHLEKLVEPTADYINLVKSMVDTVLGSVLCLFVAPWSDRFGRKPILVLGIAGSMISYLLHIVFAAWENLSPWYLLVASIPVVLTGGGASFMTILSAYLTDSTNTEERGYRLGLFDVVMHLGIILGNTVGPYLLIATNYVVVYCVATLCPLLGLIYTIYFVPESLQQRESENKVAGFFSPSNFIQMIKTPFRTRENSKRTILLLIMAVFLLAFLTDGSRSIGFFFLREKLHWTLTQFTWFGNITSILGILGTFLVVYVLHTLLHIKESILIFIGFSFSVASLVVTGFALTDWQIYLAAIINLPASGQSALTRSLISKLVHQDEIAKVFSACSIGSTILSPLSSTGYTVLYNKTINTDPGFFNFITAGIIFVAAFIYLIILIVQQRAAREDYSVLENEPNGDVCQEPQNIIANHVNEENIVTT